jgi:ATP-dependent DNA helicase RecG
MRPDALNPLFVETQALDGVGPKLMRPLEKLGLTRVRDLIYHLPERFVERHAVADLDEATVGENIIIALTVREHRSSAGRGPFRVVAEDVRGNVCSINYFGRAAYAAKKTLPVGETRWVAGRLDQYGQMLQIVHPDHVAEDAAALAGQVREPVYGLSEGMTLGRITGLVGQALKAVPELSEWCEPALIEKMGWPRWRDALETAHRRTEPLARDRLAYDELLANALALMLVKASNVRADGRADSLDRRDRRRPGAASTHAAAAAGRRRLRQDGGRALGHADRGGGRRPGRDARADRDPGASAP